MLQVQDEKIPLKADENGILHVSRTGVMLECVVELFDGGASPDEMVRQYPSLKLDDVYAVITYYLRHKEEVQTYLAERERQSEAARAAVDTKFPASLRKKLLKARDDRDGAGEG